MIENAAVCDDGYLYVIFTYIFEGDHPLILSAYRSFENSTLLQEIIAMDIMTSLFLLLNRLQTHQCPF